MAGKVASGFALFIFVLLFKDFFQFNAFGSEAVFLIWMIWNIWMCHFHQIFLYSWYDKMLFKVPMRLVHLLVHFQDLTDRHFFFFKYDNQRLNSLTNLYTCIVTCMVNIISLYTNLYTNRKSNPYKVISKSKLSFRVVSIIRCLHPKHPKLLKQVRIVQQGCNIKGKNFHIDKFMMMGTKIEKIWKMGKL